MRNCGCFCKAKSPPHRWRKPQNAFERFIFQTCLQITKYAVPKSGYGMADRAPSRGLFHVSLTVPFSQMRSLCQVRLYYSIEREESQGGAVYLHRERYASFCVSTVNGHRSSVIGHPERRGAKHRKSKDHRPDSQSRRMPSLERDPSTCRTSCAAALRMTRFLGG